MTAESKDRIVTVCASCLRVENTRNNALVLAHRVRALLDERGTR